MVADFSTGHLILAEEFIQYQNQNEAFMSMFNVVIQLGAIFSSHGYLL